MRKKAWAAAVLIGLFCAGGIVWSQRFGGGGGGGGGNGNRGGRRGGLATGNGGFGGGRNLGGGVDTGGRNSGVITYLNGDPYGIEPDGRLYSWPRRPSDLSDRFGVPTWDFDAHFKGDLFTFARVNYHSYRYSDSWATTYPYGDLNFSFRLQELTSFKVNPNPVVVKLTDKELFDYPFVYMVDVETLEFEEDDVTALRKYLLNGGFLLVDDTWGAQAWDKFHTQMQRVFPDREPTDLEISHPIFHTVFDLKEKPQIPKFTFWARQTDKSITWIRPDARYPHYWAYFDDKGRMMALICLNTDLSDGWSRELSLIKLATFRDDPSALAKGNSAEAESEEFYHNFCERLGYPLGVNIITYVMTH